MRSGRWSGAGDAARAAAGRSAAIVGRQNVSRCARPRPRQRSAAGGPPSEWTITLHLAFMVGPLAQQDDVGQLHLFIVRVSHFTTLLFFFKGSFFCVRISNGSHHHLVRREKKSLKKKDARVITSGRMTRENESNHVNEISKRNKWECQSFFRLLSLGPHHAITPEVSSF